MKQPSPVLDRVTKEKFRHAAKNVLLKQNPQRQEYKNERPTKEQLNQKYKLVQK